MKEPFNPDGGIYGVLDCVGGEDRSVRCPGGSLICVLAVGKVWPVEAGVTSRSESREPRSFLRGLAIDDPFTE